MGEFGNEGRMDNVNKKRLTQVRKEIRIEIDKGSSHTTDSEKEAIIRKKIRLR